MNKTLIIISACSGAGKSTFAEAIQALNPYDCVVCTADDFFLNSKGDYIFDASKLRQAHLECQKKAKEAMERGVEMVIIANTNTKRKEYKVYEDIAKDNNYQVHHPVLQNLHGNKDVHNVPDDVLQRQENTIRMNLKLR